MAGLKLIWVIVSLLVIASVNSQGQVNRSKRGAGSLTAKFIKAAIKAGASLVGTSVEKLRRDDFSIAVSGSIDNYFKWPLSFKSCELADGHMNVPLRTVGPGEREGFASHKTANAALGTWVRCSFIINSTVMIHFMYNAPYSFNRFRNTMAFAVCPANDDTCSGFNANKLYYNAHHFIEKREYYNNIYTLKKCNLGVCISGVMGTSHQPEISLKVMPLSYENLCGAAKDSSFKDRWSKSDYEEFIKSQ